MNIDGNKNQNDNVPEKIQFNDDMRPHVVKYRMSNSSQLELLTMPTKRIAATNDIFVSERYLFRKLSNTNFKV